MNVISLEVNFTDFAFVTLHCQNVCLVFNFAETVHTRNSQNKSHTKFKAFTVICSGNLVANFTKIFHV